ncbi:hypothetical protein THOM_3042 [Trachipleistophora hominis]|uniref:Uncharacterized protein n=1 Tax=Trachipleistophora hominis TaxID=72359 RepID=L7JRW1_TRAHO|nr:hypothetical protein THOM_3042 [Trachipleistophora hominis]
MLQLQSYAIVRRIQRNAEKYCVEERRKNAVSGEKLSKEVIYPGRNENQAKNTAVIVQNSNKGQGGDHISTPNDTSGNSFNVDLKESKETDAVNGKSRSVSNVIDVKNTSSNKAGGNMELKTDENNKTASE